jgi:hypothetical protein
MPKLTLNIILETLNDCWEIIKSRYDLNTNQKPVRKQRNESYFSDDGKLKIASVEQELNKLEFLKSKIEYSIDETQAFIHKKIESYKMEDEMDEDTLVHYQMMFIGLYTYNEQQIETSRSYQERIIYLKTLLKNNF